MKQVSTSETMAENNRKLILDFIRRNGPVSRADIKRSLDMSFPAVSSNIKSLIESGYLSESGLADNALGRKSTLVSFNSTRGYVVGIDVGRYKTRIALANITGEILETKSFDTTSMKEASQILEEIVAKISNLLDDFSLNANKILCASVGIPGIVENRSGDIQLATFLPSLTKNMITSYLVEVLSCPILIDSSMIYGAIGEKWRGSGIGCKNIIYFNYSVGLGCVLILDGEVYRGRNGASGEIGYMITDISQLRTKYQDVGVLESVISGNYIYSKLEEAGYVGGIEELIKEYNIQEFSTSFLNEISKHFMIALVNICALINPELVILGGAVGMGLGDIFISKWQEILSVHVPFPPKIVSSNLESKASLFGSIAVALRHVNDEEITT